MKKERLPAGMSLIETNQLIIGTLYQTEIVKITPECIILRCGGWYTMHTKKCINLILLKHGLGLTLSQVKGKWILSDRDNNKIPFQDGMKLTRLLQNDTLIRGISFYNTSTSLELR